MKNCIPFLFLFVLIVVGCHPTISTEKEYYSWLNNEKNELVKTKTIGDLQLAVKFFPPELLAYKELKGKKYSSREKDSLINLYSKSLTFLLTVSPLSNKGEESDVMYRGVATIEEYKSRVSKLNFEIGDMIKLDADNKQYHPVLAVMENTYSTSSSRNFYLVFNDEKNSQDLLNAKELDLEFRDEVFGAGINHFLFKKENFNNVPQINFWN